MDLNEAMTKRHSVRMYSDEPVSKAQLDDITAEIERCNAASGLHFQMAAGLEDAFCGYKTHYGRFSGVHNAIALITKIDEPYDLHPAKRTHSIASSSEKLSKPAASTKLSSTSCATQSAANPSANLHPAKPVSGVRSIPDANKPEAGTHCNTDSAAAQPVDPIPSEEAEIEEKVGYYGEQLALKLVQLGLATSWAVLDDATAGWWKLEPGERVVWILTFGYPARPGAKHHSKPLDSLCSLPASFGPDATLADAPDWFQRGIEAASLAPTSLSQQPFRFTLEDAHIADGSASTISSATGSAAASKKPLPTVSARVTPGLFAHVGLGCAKRNFEIGAGTDNFKWVRAK